MIYKSKLGEVEYCVKKLSKEHLHKIEVLQQKVCAALPDASILQPLSGEELLNILNGNGIMLGAFVEQQLIAFRALLIPNIDDPEHLGIDCGAKDLTRVLYQEISNVDPDYRGHGLQKILGELIMQQIDTMKFDVVCATVKPFNFASLKDKFSQGMVITALKLKYGGKLRYVFAKTLNQESTFTSEQVSVPMEDVVEQQQLLKNGYVGIAMKQLENSWQVLYQK